MKYGAILIDPPWSYRDTCGAGERGAAYKYSLMSIADIAALDVGNVADEDCALFCWATGPMMADAVRCIETWGFRFMTVGFVWVKLTKHRKLHWGMGSMTRANAEFVLVAKRGKPKRVSAGVHQIVEVPKRGHSVKPDEIHQRIETLLGDVSRCELFARRSRPGWRCVGFDADGMDVRDYLKGDDNG
jgi:N6-adenosine-specific RNA methylase IME4